MKYINVEIIVNVWIAMLLYNTMFKAFAATLLNAAMKGKIGDEVRNKLKDRLK